MIWWLNRTVQFRLVAKVLPKSMVLIIRKYLLMLHYICLYNYCHCWCSKIGSLSNGYAKCFFLMVISPKKFTWNLLLGILILPLKFANFVVPYTGLNRLPVPGLRNLAPLLGSLVLIIVVFIMSSSSEKQIMVLHLFFFTWIIW